MEKLSYYAMKADLEIHKKLIELLNLRTQIKSALETNNNPIKEDEYNKALEKIEELIGVIRYHSLDEMNILTPEVEEKPKQIEEGFNPEDEDLYDQIDKMLE